MTLQLFAPRLRRYAGQPGSTAELADWTPRVDILEHSDRFVVDADVPGVAPDSIDIEMQDNVLTISGTRELAEEGEATLRRERPAGRFLRRFTLPVNVDGDAIEARCQHGLLQVTIPKQQKPAARRIEVEAA